MVARSRAELTDRRRYVHISTVERARHFAYDLPREFAAMPIAKQHFDDIQLRSLSSRIAEVIDEVGPTPEDQVSRVFAKATSIEIPKNRERLFGRFVWSARGRKLLQETENGSGVLVRAKAATSDNDAFGNETFQSIQELIEAVDPDRSTSFELLCDTVVQFLEDRGCRNSRLLRGTVGSAIWATGRRAARER